MYNKNDPQLAELFNEKIVLPPEIPASLPALEPISIQYPTSNAQQQALKQSKKVLALAAIIFLFLLIIIGVIITKLIR